MDFQLRTYAFIDRMQPQAAAHVAATCQGDVPIAGMSELYIEVAPGNEIFRCADVALKAADVRPALQVVEREFGLLEIHSRSQAEVQAAGQAVLEHLQLKEAVEYAHKKGLAIKGDIPIGIDRFSADAWMAPQLFLLLAVWMDARDVIAGA